MRIADAATVRSEEELRSGYRADRARAHCVIVAKVAESAPTAKPPLDCVFLKHRFMSGDRQSGHGGRRQAYTS